MKTAIDRYRMKGLIVNGMTNMNKLTLFIDSFIRDNKEIVDNHYMIDFDCVPYSDLSEFASHLIELDSKKHEGWEWLLEATFRDDASLLFSKYLSSYGEKKLEVKEDFLDELNKAAIFSLIPRMKELVDARLDLVKSEDDQELRFPTDMDEYRGAAYL